MRWLSSSPLALLAPLIAASCDGGAMTAAHPTFRVSVSPLTLSGVGAVCYDIEVSHGDETVWRKGNPLTTLLGEDQDPDDFRLVNAADTGTLCTDVFGGALGLDLTYIGTCQADPADGYAGTINAVTLWVDGLYDRDKTTDIGEWVDPCPDGCTILARCYENADTRIDFNLTIMREANQGFFDFAVNFDRIYCSGKLDCTNDDEGRDPIRLLYNPHTRSYAQTLVLGRSCTGGVGADTRLLLSETEIACGYRPFNSAPIVAMVRFLIDPAVGDGNQGLSNVTYLGPQGGVEWSMSEDELAQIIYQNANYLGAQTLDEDGTSYGLIYANQAIGFDYTALQEWAGAAQWLVGICTIRNRWTASDGPLPALSPVPGAHTTYPIVEVEGTIFQDGLTCSRHPLNGPGGMVQSVYEPLDAAYELDRCVAKDEELGGLSSCEDVAP
jgi:hypothetical protein